MQLWLHVDMRVVAANGPFAWEAIPSPEVPVVPVPVVIQAYEANRG